MTMAGLFRDFVLFDKKWRVLRIYTPNIVSGEEGFFRNYLAPFVATDKRMVVMDDFNCVCGVRNRAEDNDYTDKSVRVLKILVDNNDLIDAVNTKGRAGNLIYSRLQGVSHARLDRIYVSCHDRIKSLNTA